MNDTTDSATRDYKQTLNLPQTEFPMQAGLATREPLMLSAWEAAGLYAQVQAATKSATKHYWFVDGPPYANGDIHIGHAVNKVLKDMIVKAARLDGFNAPFVPGWDCHGLPIELQVEKKFGKVGEKLNAAEFRAECRKYAHEQIERQRVDFKRLGILADWEKPYLTMQPAFEAEQLRVLARIVENGHVVRGFKPVHWCLDCGSSLAEAEVEYEDKKSSSIFVKFEVATESRLSFNKVFAIDAASKDAVKPAYFVIWTTTPWTLPANQAICVNADLSYALVDMGAEYWVIAEARLDALKAEFSIALPYKNTQTGKFFWDYSIKAIHPFIKRTVPIIYGEHVTTEAGTGLVHTAPAHGAEDYQVGLQFKLPVDNPVGADGVFVVGTPLVAGVHVRKAEVPIVDELKATHSLIRLESFTHSYPHCWRHKTPLIFRATPQWFMAMDGEGSTGSVRAMAVKAIDEDVRFIPDWGRARIHGMVADRPDWCISRQRTWGVPLALLVHKQTQEPHPRAAQLLRTIADKVEAEGLEAWFGSTPADWLPASEAADYDRCPDTLDVWFDSGSVHQCSFVSTNPGALDADGLAPLADMYLEGSDQHRGWFQSSLLTSIAMRGRAPYKTVLTHGFTVDEQGRKMSKSLGNVVAPQTVTKTLGADVLRLWVSASDYSGEIAISDNLLKRIADAYRRIRNTARYLLSNLHGFVPSEHLVAPADMVAIDRWAIASAAKLQAELQQAYRDAEFHQVYQKLHNYCVVDLGGLYLDVLKDRLYTLPEASPARRSAQSALFHIAEAFTRWIAPILSFTADEIWKLLPGDRAQSVFAQQWYAFPASGADTSTTWQRLTAARDAVKKTLEDLRAQSLIGSGLDAAVTLYADGDLHTALAMTGDELRFWLITSDASTKRLSEKPRNAIEAKLESGETLWIAASATDAQKCGRCWHRRPDVGAHAAHSALCGRCIENIDGAGEVRRFI